MDKCLQLWNEYLILRDEIKSADALNYQIMGVVVGAVAAILVAGFAQTNISIRPFVFLCAYIVIIPGYKLLCGNRSRIWRISTYIRVFLESDSELKYINWESRLDFQRSEAKDLLEKMSLSSLIGKNEWFIVTFMSITASTATLIALLQVTWFNYDKCIEEGTLVSINLVFWIVTFIAVLIFTIYRYVTSHKQEEDLRRLGKIEENYYTKWQAVKEEEKNKS